MFDNVFLMHLSQEAVWKMPLFKRKPFGLAEPPEDLDLHELVYQVRFTKEIFRDYQYPKLKYFEAIIIIIFSWGL